MQTKEYTFVDRTGWPEGHWDNEPDKVQWQDEVTGLPCIARRTDRGHWCGYVGVSETNSLFKKYYFDIIDANFSVHGGLTYSSFCDPQENEHGICHVPDAGEPDHIWWFGFDCAHAGDLSPGYCTMYKQLGFKSYEGMEYRTLEYVKAECAQLARQLRECEQHGPS